MNINSYATLEYVESNRYNGEACWRLVCWVTNEQGIDRIEDVLEVAPKRFDWLRNHAKSLGYLLPTMTRIEIAVKALGGWDALNGDDATHSKLQVKCDRGRKHLALTALDSQLDRVTFNGKTWSK